MSDIIWTMLGLLVLRIAFYFLDIHNPFLDGFLRWETLGTFVMFVFFCSMGIGCIQHTLTKELNELQRKSNDEE